MLKYLNVLDKNFHTIYLSTEICICNILFTITEITFEQEQRYNDKQEQRYNDKQEQRYNDKQEQRYNDKQEQRYNDKQEQRYNDKQEQRYNDKHRSMKILMIISLKLNCHLVKL